MRFLFRRWIELKNGKNYRLRSTEAGMEYGTASWANTQHCLPTDSLRLPQTPTACPQLAPLPPAPANTRRRATHHSRASCGEEKAGAGPAALECASAPTGLLLPPRAVLIGAAVTALVVWLRPETRLALAGRALKPQQFS